MAEANAITDSSASLSAGTILQKPSVASVKNDANSFKPYNPNEIVGSTTPSLPYVPPAPCNPMMIIVIIVMIIVTIYTAGAAAGAMGGTGTVAGGTAAAAGTTVTAGAGVSGAVVGGVTTSAGAAGSLAAAGTMGGALMSGGVVAGITTAQAIGAVFIGGVAGSIAGQVVGNALGVSQGFSLRQAIAGGITSVLTAGIAGGLGGNTGSLMSKADTLGSWGKVAASALGNASAGYVGNRIAGVQDTHFSWKSIAASAVTNVATAAVGNALNKVDYLKNSDIWGEGSLPGNFARNAIGGVVGLHVRRAFGFDDRVDYGSIAADAFGNAVASAMVQRASAPSPKTQIMRMAEIEQTYVSEVDDLIQAIEPMDYSDLQVVAEPVASASRSRPAIVQEKVSSANSALQANVIRPNRNLTADNLVDTIEQISASPRQPYTYGVRVFDRDAIRMQFSINGLGGMNEQDFAEHEALVARLRNAEATIPGDAQLLVAFKPGMSRQAMLADSVRIGGGYMSVQSGFNLLKQINSGANVIDLTYVRADSEAYLDYKMQSPELHAARMQTAVINARRVSTASPYRDQEDQLRRSDSLMPGRLKITETGVMREVNRAIMKANLASLAVDVAGIALFMGLRATATKGALSGLAADGLTLNRTTLRGLAKDLRPNLERMRVAYSGRFANVERVPGGGLLAHEGVLSIFGKPSHLVSDHVGQTFDQMSTRLATNPGLRATSTFDSLVSADGIVADAMLLRQSEIDAFMSRPFSATQAENRLRLDVQLDTVTGSILNRNAATLMDGTGVRLIIDKIPNRAGYPVTIVTGFPIK